MKIVRMELEDGTVLKAVPEPSMQVGCVGCYFYRADNSCACRINCGHNRIHWALDGAPSVVAGDDLRGNESEQITGSV